MTLPRSPRLRNLVGHSLSPRQNGQLQPASRLDDLKAQTRPYVHDFFRSEGRDVGLAFAKPAKMVYNRYRTASITLFVGHQVYLPTILKSYP